MTRKKWNRLKKRHAKEFQRMGLKWELSWERMNPDMRNRIRRYSYAECVGRIMKWVLEN